MSASIQPTVRTGHRVQFRKTRLPTLERDPNQGRDSIAVSGKYLFSSCINSPFKSSKTWNSNSRLTQDKVA
jgi:hypothetical protein